MRWTAVHMKMPEGYIAFVEELPCANTQAETLEEARANLGKRSRWCWMPTASCRRSRWRARSSSAAPRHREVNDFLVRKICDDLQAPCAYAAKRSFSGSETNAPPTIAKEARYSPCARKHGKHGATPPVPLRSLRSPETTTPRRASCLARRCAGRACRRRPALRAGGN